MMNPQELADRVFNRRRDLGLSQGQLAQLAGISRNYISLIERGEATNLSLNVLNSLAAALQLSPADLTGDLGATVLIPPALRQFGIEAGLSFDVVDRLARIPRRGQEPQSPEEWAALFEAIRPYLE
jgi:transcriptional regulator with XRE-family HTH domain